MFVGDLYTPPGIPHSPEVDDRNMNFG